MVKDFRWALDEAERTKPRPNPAAGSQADKKNYAERLSRAIAWMLGDALRPQFKGVIPDEQGKRQESVSFGGKGPIKIDVNFSTPELGLALGVSVKTLNFRDGSSGRYTKNYTRIDKELRAEAKDVHQRQPYAVLVGAVFLPVDCCDDAKKSGSSFYAAVRCFLHRAGRQNPNNEQELFERVFVALYEHDGANRGGVGFFDVMQAPPLEGRPDPALVVGLDQFVQEIRETFYARNPRLRP
jgi:hypothetical protein